MGGRISTKVIIHRTTPIQFHVSGLHQEPFSLSETMTPKHPLILGLPWMELHNLQISWPEKEIMRCSEYCFHHCLLYPSLAIASTTIEPRPAPPVHILKEYLALLDIFSKTKAKDLSPHQPYSCAIDLLPGTTPPCNRAHPLYLVEQ